MEPEGLTKKPWYHAKMSRQEAETFLAGKPFSRKYFFSIFVTFSFVFFFFLFVQINAPVRLSCGNRLSATDWRCRIATTTEPLCTPSFKCLTKAIFYKKTTCRKSARSGSPRSQSCWTRCCSIITRVAKITCRTGLNLLIELNMNE